MGGDERLEFSSVVKCKGNKTKIAAGKLLHDIDLRATQLTQPIGHLHKVVFQA